MMYEFYGLIPKLIFLYSTAMARFWKFQIGSKKAKGADWATGKHLFPLTPLKLPIYWGRFLWEYYTNSILDHHLRTTSTNKKVLAFKDDKRSTIDRINTICIGHYKIDQT